MAQAATDLTSSVPPSAPPVAVEARKTPPVKIWAFFGALIVAFIAFVLIRWVTGPYFERVPTGVSDPPTLMKVALIFWQAVSIPAALFLIYWFVIRPWRRERTIGLDGMLVIAFATLWFQDPLSASVGGPWFVYNSWMLNFGSWVNDVPGWMSFGEPGAMIVEPILFTQGAYVYVFVITMLLGCWVMRKAKARWPTISNLGLIGICFAAMIAFDIVLEGILWLPMGVFEYPGGHIALFPSTYHKYPLNEAITVSALFTAVASIRYFVNDRGQHIAERGIDQVRSTPGRKLVLRALATIAVVHLSMLVLYNVPNSWINTHSTEWPEDLQKRSYFTMGVCGEGTDRACPGPAVPLIRNYHHGVKPDNHSLYVDPAGNLVTPKNRTLPPVVPLEQGD